MIARSAVHNTLFEASHPHVPSETIAHAVMDGQVGDMIHNISSHHHDHHINLIVIIVTILIIIVIMSGIPP